MFGSFVGSKNHIWLVALGTLLNRFLESLLYIYAIPFVWESGTQFSESAIIQ